MVSIVRAAVSTRWIHSCIQPRTTLFSRAFYSNKFHLIDNSRPKIPLEVDPKLIEYAESFYKNKKEKFHHCGLSIPGTPDHDRAVQNFLELIEKTRAQLQKKN